MGDIARQTDSLSRLLELGFERVRDVRDVPTITEDARVDRHTHRVTVTCGGMGTHVAITALGASRQRLDDAIGAAFDEMDRLVAIFSRHDPDSAVSDLNAAGSLRGPPEELTHVLRCALEYHAITGGAFDITVAPLLDLFGRCLGGASPHAPSEGELRDARALVGARAVNADHRRARLGRAGMRVTLDGIAKGFIVDRMADTLEAAHVRNFLLDAGGDLRARGRKEAGQPWLVAVQDPERGGAFPDVLHLGTAAVATSGSYERYFDPARRFHHLVDAGTGESPTECASVSVVAATAMQADVLATSVFLMGPARGMAFVASLPGCECLIIERSGRQHRSRGWTSAAPAPPAAPHEIHPRTPDGTH